MQYDSLDLDLRERLSKPGTNHLSLFPVVCISGAVILLPVVCISGAVILLPVVCVPVP